jgi:3-oxoacyl-(acyl-carrier-protein) synthase
MAERAAIVGMAARFAGAPDLETYRKNLWAGTDAITSAPPDRLDPVYFDPSSREPDRLYARRGGFLDEPVRFDAVAFGIMPVAAQGAEPDQLLALEAAARALEDAALAAVPRERTAVIVGRGGYLTAGMARLDQRVRVAEQIARSLRTLVPGLDEAQIAAVKSEFQARVGPFGGDTAIGLVPNLAASRIANRLDLGGPAYTVDAACASSLLAVDHAVRELSSGRSDLAIAGGVHLCHDPTFWSVFCQLGALSRSERIRPFDRRADGLLIGEGAGMVVLKRLADAERDGDRVYAVVRGSGVSSDGRAASLMTPAVGGQILALRRAWDEAGIDPGSVGLVEAHGTGTPAGDAAEVETLRRFFGGARAGESRAALGSVKSMIGHAMPAAGIAGLIKAALAIHHRVLPPSLHCEEPRADLAATRFRVLARSEPWEDGAAPRRAGVNAFGFGGVNAHVVLEEHGGSPARATVSVPDRIAGEEPPPLLLAAPTQEALLASLDGGDASPGGPCRLALFNPTPERRARARAIVARGEAWRGRDDLWFSPRGLATEGGRVALLFPGVDSSFEPRLDDVIRRFDLPFRVDPKPSGLKDLGLSIIAAGRALHAALSLLGVRAHAIAGHSIGEWAGMIASEMIPRDEIDLLIESLAPESVEVPGVVFVAAGTGVDKARAALAGLDDIAISHDNCPHQVILCGREESAAAATERLKRAGVLCQVLPFRSGYHSPLFADYVAPHRRILSRVPLVRPAVRLWSATSAAPYPSDPEAIRALAVEHLVRPVRFRELTLALHEDGARIFVQVGTGSLVNFVSDTLRGRPHLAISANVPARSGLAQLQRVAAALFVEGATVELDRLGIAPRLAPRAAGEGGVVLSLGAPLVTFDEPLVLPGAREDTPLDGDNPIEAELAASRDELTTAQREVVAALRGDEPTTWGPRETTQRYALSAGVVPELLDHTFYRQPAGWPSVADRYPVVPMTMLLALMMDAAADLCPELCPVGLEDVRALRWLAVEPPVEVTVTARHDGESRVEVTVEGYSRGTVVMARGYPPAPRARTAPLAGEKTPKVTAADLYEGRWMFHGPAYQGVERLGAIGDDGIQGTLVSLAAPGGLLDNAGQLLGYWVMERSDRDQLAMPVRIARASFSGPHPPPGERLDCDVRIRHFDATSVVADIDLGRGGGVWARIEGWEDRRFDSDARVWEVLRFPERSLLATVRGGAYAVVATPWRAVASRDLMARRYLGERGRAELAAAGPRRQEEWLLGRIAVIDCARRLLWDRGHGAIFPAEIDVEGDPATGVALHGPLAAGLQAAVAYAGGVAAARVVAGGETPATTIERIAEGGDETEARRLAAARLPGGRAVETRREGDHIVAWTSR